MRLNKARVARAEATLAKAEYELADPRRMSTGTLWRQDVLAFRYVVDTLKKLAEREQ